MVYRATVLKKSAASVLRIDVNPKNKSSSFLGKVGTHLPPYTASKP
jgi:hypothetical protein